MQHFSRKFLAASISIILLAPAVQAQVRTPEAQKHQSKQNNANSGDNSEKSTAVPDDQQKISTPEQCSLTDPIEDDSQEPVTVKADNLKAENGNTAVYSGNVEVTQGKRKITADSVTLHQKENVVVAEGDVTFHDKQVKAKSQKVTNNLNDNTFSLENTQYQFVCQKGRGTAAYIARTGQSVYTLEDGTITSCPEGDDSWRLVASGIDVDQDEETATLYNPRFEIENVPVFYSPYLTFPIGDTRKSGFLYPSISYGSSDGTEVSIPFYWNIAPNYDMTLTTTNMQKRGTKFDTDFRYLTDGWGSGSIKTEYLAKDKKYEDGQQERWGYQFQHYGIIDRNWVVLADYSKVSDIDYFQDLDSNIGNREDGQLLREGQVQYRTQNWNMKLTVKDFQILLADSNQPYRLLPQLEGNYYAPLWKDYVNFDVFSQISRFDTLDTKKPDATRVHVEPGITIPLSTTWATWTTEGRILATYYQQDFSDINDPSFDQNKYDKTVARVIPEFRSHARIYLERDTQLFDGYTQSLEPQVQYLYVPNKNQNNIYQYDTTLMQTDYYGLFRSRKYSSVDYIAPANQLSYGASSRFFDDQYKERFNISFGQIYYIKQQVERNHTNNTDKTSSSYSSWAVDMDFNYDDYLFYHGGIQYDLNLSAVQLANSSLEYQYDKGFVQTNYRYVTRDYINDTIQLDDVDTITRKGISQLGLVSGYTFNPKWSVSGQYYYDLNEHNDLERRVNIRYQSDCWYVGMSFARQLLGWTSAISEANDTSAKIGVRGSSAQYENNVGINFGIRGFATNDSGKTATDELLTTKNIIKYGRPFSLSN